MAFKILLIVALVFCVESYSDLSPHVKRIIHYYPNGTITCTGECYSPDEHLTAPDLITKLGYPAETHTVKTEDGYLLQVHRIPSDQTVKGHHQPVFFQHGLLGSSDDWIITKNKSLAFMLSDMGYDVWLGNARGNSYSKTHVTLDPDSTKYWNFSFHEMGIYDLPAVINHISDITGKGGEIIYVGHSMGTTMFFVFASLRPTLAKQIKLAVAMAPVAYMTNIRSPIRYIAPWVSDIQWIAKYMGLKQFLPDDRIMKFLEYDCELLKVATDICKNLIFSICGFDNQQFDEELLPMIFAHSPAGSSTKTIIHYAQEIHNDGNFMFFDYGPRGNKVEYGTTTPPMYNLSNIHVPTYMMYGNNDWLAGPIDVKKLAQALPSVNGAYEIPFKQFNHLDFLWAKDAPTLVYDNAIIIIRIHQIGFPLPPFLRHPSPKHTVVADDGNDVNDDYPDVDESYETVE